jgi:Putative restriction endonuclease
MPRMVLVPLQRGLYHGLRKRAVAGCLAGPQGALSWWTSDCNMAGFAPDVAFEILSPSNTPSYIQRKRKDYQESGIIQFWIDSDLGLVEVVVYTDRPSSYFRKARLLSSRRSPVLPGSQPPLFHVVLGARGGIEVTRAPKTRAVVTRISAIVLRQVGPARCRCRHLGFSER